MYVCILYVWGKKCNKRIECMSVCVCICIYVSLKSYFILLICRVWNCAAECMYAIWPERSLPVISSMRCTRRSLSMTDPSSTSSKGRTRTWRRPRSCKSRCETSYQLYIMNNMYVCMHACFIWMYLLTYTWRYVNMYACMWMNYGCLSTSYHVNTLV